MKKKFGLGIIITIEILCLLCVYVIKGMPGAYAWTLALFILAPIACIALVVQITFVIVRTCKHKSNKWNIIYLLVTLLVAYPITILLGISNITYPTSDSNENAVRMQIPIENAVLRGGKEYKTHAVWPSECYAYDIVATPHDVGTEQLSDYGAFGADVIAPISGTVIDIENSEENILPNTDEFISALGNYIFIEIEETKTYLILAHLEKDSINLKVGDKVETGTRIAKVGNSGTTSEPHLHIQHQRNNPLTMIFPTCSEGLPIEWN